MCEDTNCAIVLYLERYLLNFKFIHYNAPRLIDHPFLLNLRNNINEKEYEISPWFKDHFKDKNHLESLKSRNEKKEKETWYGFELINY